MDEYIKRKDAEEYIKNFGKGAISDGLKTLDPVDDIVLLAKGINMIPAADVVEVKHGYWKRQKGRPEAICSECGREVVYQTINNKWWFENYCPHCGADMRKKVQRNDATGSD